MCAASIEQLIDRRIDKWSAMDLPRHGVIEQPHRPVITISREFGAGGKQVADNLAAEMELVLFDREIIDRIAEQAHISARMVATLDEHHRSAMESWVEGILKARLFDRSEYVQHLLKLMKTLSIRGGCVILGRGANVVLMNEPGAYHFRLTADESVRISRIAARDRISHEKAAEIVAQTARDRRQFMRHAFPHFNVDDSTAYHMIFNSGRMNLDTITRIIRDFVETSERRRRAN